VYEGIKTLMDKTTWNSFSNVTAEGQWPGVDSVYRLIVVAALRNKQLSRGATPRIEADPLKRRSTSIALEEVKRGLVHFTTTDEKDKNGEGGK
jgi:DNA-directed RNA polymerase omega subunit